MALLDFSKATFGASTGIGQFYAAARFDSEANIVPMQCESGQRLSYTVPANTKATIQSILITSDRSWCASPGVTANAGTCTFRLNGSDQMEFRVQETGWWLPPGAETYKQEQHKGNGISMWDVAFASGDILVARFTGASSTACYLVDAAIIGDSAGTPVFTTGRQVVSGNAATDIATYTVPVAGFTLKHIRINAQVRGGPELPLLTVRVNGVPIAEAPTFRAVDSMGAPPRIAIPLFGIELYPGDTISLDASSLWRMDEYVTMAVMGSTAALGGGGGGNTYSRGRVVNA